MTTFAACTAAARAFARAGALRRDDAAAAVWTTGGAGGGVAPRGRRGRRRGSPPRVAPPAPPAPGGRRFDARLAARAAVPPGPISGPISGAVWCLARAGSEGLGEDGAGLLLRLVPPHEVRLLHHRFHLRARASVSGGRRWDSRGGELW